MCWIFAYNWKENSIPFLVEWLRRLEYRGYDSAWILAVNKDSEIFLEKEVWKVSNLASKINKNPKKEWLYCNWIAHTRWATHWKVTLENTHPHQSQNWRFFIVHNWIIENYFTIKKELEKKYKFYSETDTEVVAKLFEELYDWDLHSTLEKVTKQIVWAYAIAVIDRENPDVLIWAKLWSPMIIWVSDDAIFLSSDINALWNVATEFTTLDDYETVVIKNGKFEVFSFWKVVEKETEEITEEMWNVSKGKFETFTEKEIFETSQVLRNALNWRINFDTKTITNETLEELNSYDFENIEIIASGSSFFAWVVGKSWFEELAEIKTEVRVSSEFLYEKFIPNKKTLYIFMSQSWKMMFSIWYSKCRLKHNCENVRYVTLYSLLSWSLSCFNEKYYCSTGCFDNNGYFYVNKKKFTNKWSKTNYWRTWKIRFKNRMTFRKTKSIQKISKKIWKIQSFLLFMKKFSLLSCLRS